VDSFVQCEDSKMHTKPYKQQETSIPFVPLPLGTPQAAVHPQGMIGQVNQPLVRAGLQKHCDLPNTQMRPFQPSYSFCRKDFTY
jgi:hypothetical protein